MDALQKLREYINQSRAPLPPVTDPDEPLHIDSLFFIRLVTFLDTDLNIRVEEDELVAENFATMRALEKLVAEKAAASNSAPSPSTVSQGRP